MLLSSNKNFIYKNSKWARFSLHPVYWYLVLNFGDQILFSWCVICPVVFKSLLLGKFFQDFNYHWSVFLLWFSSLRLLITCMWDPCLSSVPIIFFFFLIYFFFFTVFTCVVYFLSFPFAVYLFTLYFFSLRLQLFVFHL